MRKPLEKSQKEAKAGSQSGFTLIEVLIGISILTIGLLGVAKMQVTAIQGNYFSGNTTTALALAEQRMEALLGTDYNDAAMDSGNHDDGNMDDAGQGPAGIYHRTYDVVDGTPIPNVTKTVTITVGWQNDTHRVSISSIRRL